MNGLLGLILVLIIVGIIVWGAKRILAVLPMDDPMKTIVWVLIVVFAALFCVQALFGVFPGWTLRTGRNLF